MRKIGLIKYINIAQAFIFAFILYVMWYNEAITENRMILYLSAIGATIFVFIDVLRGHHIRRGLYSIVPLLFVYIISSLVFGLVFSSDRGYLVSSIITLTAFAIMCFNICYTASRMQSMDWLLSFIIVVAFICAIQTIIWGVTVRSTTAYVITMGENNNPNSLGLYMLLGIFAVINRKSYRKNYLFTIISIATFMYVIVLSGSRKFLLSGAILILVWLLVDIVKNDENGKGYRKLFKIVVICIVGIIVTKFLWDNFVNSAAFERLEDLGDGQSIKGRLDLYKEALRLFKTNPFFGVGYRQYEIVSPYGLYSHSTYAEILSCTGLIGVFAWLCFLVALVKSLFLKYTKVVRNSGESYRVLMCIIMFAIELILGLGQIWFYDFPHLLILTFIFGFPTIQESRLNTEGRTNG